MQVIFLMFGLLYAQAHYWCIVLATSQSVKSTHGGNKKGTVGRGHNKGVNTRPSGRGKKPGKVSNNGKLSSLKEKVKERKILFQRKRRVEII